MTLDITVQDRPAMHFIGVPVTARFSEFGAPDGPNSQVPRIYQWLADHEIIPLGGPLYVYRHLGSDEEPSDLTVGVPVAETVNPSSGLVLGTLPAGAYIVGRHVGSPDQLFAANSKVLAWAEENGHVLNVTKMSRGDRDDRWTGFAEHFLTNPEEEPDLSQWVTELLYAIA